ncbi:transmembrane protein, putative [Medicago truncatula]|uniref:Transmembrane protein, putative n=1 Tax=Medicago truncatula TaxID=3880 RepID=A0A072UV93_MEDTR|nr:transmembrane protein, putative [Medicago truncatula]
MASPDFGNDPIAASDDFNIDFHELLRRRHHVQDKQIHRHLQQDLIEHIWELIHLLQHLRLAGGMDVVALRSLFQFDPWRFNFSTLEFSLFDVKAFALVCLSGILLSIGALRV